MRENGKAFLRLKQESGEGGSMAGGQIPISEGETHEVSIDAAGAKGDGIAHVEGFVVFVAGAKIGEKCKVKITKVARTYAMAEKV